ncbi:MAG: NAD(P)/FAD-dependent oxidoreductase [Actinomycetota bacterium]
MKTYDVGIIGAGIHGASAAYHLASRGVKTVIFERWGAAGGPTGRSSGICRAYYTNEFLAVAARDSIEMLENFAEITNGCDAGFHRTGFLFLHPRQDAVPLWPACERLNALGVTVDVLAGDRLRSEFPMFDLDGIDVGVWEVNAGYADPAGATLGMLARAVELGVTTHMGTQVAELRPIPGGGCELVTTTGMRTVCRKLLVAAGPWTAPLMRQVGVELPLTVERHVVAVGAWGPSTPLPFGHADLSTGYYCKPEGRELFCLGWLHPSKNVDPDDFPQRISDDEVAELLATAVRRVPGLAEVGSRGGWASLYDVSPDWQPVIGEVAEGIFVDAGTSGHGFKLAPALGRHVADLVTGDAPDPALEQFHPRRFSDGVRLAAGYGAAKILG